MRIGIIAEGTEDQAVISNILRAFGVNKSDILFIKPDLESDENDFPDNPTIGTFQGVRNACLGQEGRRHYFELAFGAFEADFVVIHLDTAEIDAKPPKTDLPTYSEEVRRQVIEMINGWLDNLYQDKLLYAIAIEEIEAWCLTIYVKTDTTASADAKSKLLKGNHSVVAKKGLSVDGNNMARTFENEITPDFRKIKKLITFLPYNHSLRAFVESLQAIIPS